MANNFKSSGISGVGTSLGSASTLYTAATGINSIVIELDIANTGTGATSASVIFEDSSANSTYHIIKNAPLPSGSTLKVISGQKYFKENIYYGKKRGTILNARRIAD